MNKINILAIIIQNLLVVLSMIFIIFKVNSWVSYFNVFLGLLAINLCYQLELINKFSEEKK